MKYLIFSFFLASYCLAADRLKEVVLESVDTHPEICSRCNEYTSTRELIKKARSKFLPQASAFYDTGPEYAKNSSTDAILGGSSNFRREDITVEATQVLFDGGNRSSDLRRNKATSSAAYHDLMESQEKVAFRASEAYLNILRTRKISQIYQIDVDSHIEMVGKVDKRVEGGAAKKSEIQLAKSRLALARSRLLKAEANQREAENEFLEIVGRGPEADMEMPEIPVGLPESVEEAIEQAFYLNPSLHASYDRSRAARAQVGVSKSALYPTVSLDVSAYHGNNLNGVPGPNKLYTGLVSVSWDFFTGGGNRAQVRSDEALYRQKLCEIDDTSRRIKNTVATALDFYQIDRERLIELKIYREESYQVYESYLKEYLVEARSLFDLLNAQIEYYNAQVNEVNGVFDMHIDTYRLLSSMGILVEFFTCMNTVFETGTECDE